MEEKNVNVTVDEQVEETIDQAAETNEIRPAAVEQEPTFFEKHPKIKLAAKVTGGVVIASAVVIGGVKIAKVVFNKEVAKQVAKATVDTVPKQMIEKVPDVVENVAEAAETVGLEVGEF